MTRPYAVLALAAALTLTPPAAAQLFSACPGGVCPVPPSAAGYALQPGGYSFQGGSYSVQPGGYSLPTGGYSYQAGSRFASPGMMYAENFARSQTLAGNPTFFSEEEARFAGFGLRPYSVVRSYVVGEPFVVEDSFSSSYRGYGAAPQYVPQYVPQYAVPRYYSPPALMSVPQAAPAPRGVLRQQGGRSGGPMIQEAIIRDEQAPPRRRGFLSSLQPRGGLQFSFNTWRD